MTNWAEELKEDAACLKRAAEREARRSRRLRAMEVAEVQALMERESVGFAAVIHARKGLKELLGGKPSGGSGSGNDYVIKHKQVGHVDERLVTMYEALWLKAYGTDAGYIGDPNAVSGVGSGNQFRMGSSGERVYRAGATKKGGGLGASRRSIIKDEKAFNFKRKMDKRMRRMASEIQEYLSASRVGEVMIAEAGGGGSARCQGCQCFMERDWRFCARCGQATGDFASRERATRDRRDVS